MKVKKILKVVTDVASESLGLNGERETASVSVRHIYKRFAALLSKAMGYSYEEFEHDTGGLLQPDGNWTGVIGMLNRSEADLAFMGLFVSEERSQAVSFSYPFTIGDITFVTEKISPSPNPLAIAFIFSDPVWLALVATMVLTMFAFFITSRGRHSPAKIAFDVVAASLRQPGSIKPFSRSEYLLILTWHIGMTFLTSCYMSLLLSFMSFPSLKGIYTVPQLANAVAREGYQCMTLENSPIGEWFSTSDNKNLKIIGDNMNSSPLGFGNIVHFINNAERKVVYVEGRQFISFLGERYFISDDYFMIALVSIAMNRNFCCKSEVDKAIRTITETGLYLKLTRDNDFNVALTELPPDTSTKRSPRTLSMHDIAGAFIVLIAGYILSIIFLLIEMFVSKLPVNFVTKKKRILARSMNIL